jgi:hypothetical protein
MAFPATYNINYYKGDTYSFEISPKNADASVFSLTGYTPSMMIASARDHAPDFSITATADFNDPTERTTIICTITPTVGRQLVAGTQYVYDVEIAKTDNSEVHTLLTGTISVTADVTGA